MTDLPWPSSSNSETSKSADVLKDPGFLKRAREQLDADHYGLDKIKRRLIEYLAIARLKQLAIEEEPKTAKVLESQSGDKGSDAGKTPSTPAAEGAEAKEKINPAASPSTRRNASRKRSSVEGPILL